MKIGSVTLDHKMIWEDEFLWSPMNCESWEPAGGGMSYQETKNSDEAGRPITLVFHCPVSQRDQAEPHTDDPGV